MYINEAARLFKSLLTNPTTVIVGFRHKGDLYHSSGTYSSLAFRVNGTTQCWFGMLRGGRIGFYRGSTLLFSSSRCYELQAWSYFEFKVTFSLTVGTVDVKVDGVSVISETGVNTCYEGTNEYTDQFYIGNGTSEYVYFDDLYVCDATGLYNNDFLGDVKVDLLYPTSDGTYTDFTPSTGIDHFALVDDPQLLSDTDHNESSTIGHKDNYGMTTYSSGATIFGLQISAAVKNTDVGTMNVRTLLRSGGTPADTEGSSVVLSQTMTGIQTTYDREPIDSVAWTTTNINNAEFGIKVQS